MNLKWLFVNATSHRNLRQFRVSVAFGNGPIAQFPTREKRFGVGDAKAAVLFSCGRQSRHCAILSDKRSRRRLCGDGVPVLGPGQRAVMIVSSSSRSLPA
jgi:hypothetical protein